MDHLNSKLSSRYRKSVVVVVEVEVAVVVVVEVLDWVVVGDAELPAKWICTLVTVTMTLVTS